MEMQVPLLLIILVFHTSAGLRCIKNCKQIFNISQPFNDSSYRCGRPAENARLCYVKMEFFFHLDEVTMLFTIDPSINHDFIRIEPGRAKQFSYQIGYACTDFDDCARTFAEKKMIEMKEKPYNISSIHDDFDVLLGRSDTSKELICYDGNQTTNLCSAPDKLCYLEHHQITNVTDTSSCPKEYNYFTASVVVRDQGNGAALLVRCSRDLCNTAETVNAVKQVLFKHQITDKNGRTRSWTTNTGIISIGVLFNIVLALLLICMINFM
jgi:tetrahydromethanopterin S-methyltransferase subunit F